jgi:TPP-dependent trihydroxycyclohexane-1,2-dione (THcHDO) dehydratase
VQSYRLHWAQICRVLARRHAPTVVETDIAARVSNYESSWRVPISEVSTVEAVGLVREKYREARKRERHYL